MTTILIRAHKHPFRVADADETLEQNLIGGNAGNLVFSQAVVRLLATAGTAIRTASLPREKPPLDIDHLVLPMANAFRARYADRLERLTEIIEQARVPVTVLGVGAQATLRGARSGTRLLDDAVRRFVSAALRHGNGPIGVRGQFTRDYLRGLGFPDHEIAVTGCPSMFMWGPDLRIDKRVPELGRDSPIAFNVSPYVPQIGPISRNQAARYRRLIYLAQNIQTLELLITGQYPADPESAVVTIGGPVDLDHPLIAEDRTRFFLDPTTWIDDLAGYDFSFGTRIHGNIAALLAGTPALVLAHDARTLELAEYHEIPHRLITDHPGRIDAADLYAEADWEPLNAGHPARWQIFSEFLREHGLRTVFDDDEDRGAGFDARLSAIDFPGPVRTIAATPLAELYAMRRELVRLQRQAAELRAREDRSVAGGFRTQDLGGRLRRLAVRIRDR